MISFAKNKLVGCDMNVERETVNTILPYFGGV